MTLEEKVASLEAQMAKMIAANDRQRRDEITTHLIDKLRLDESYEPMLELAVEKTDISDGKSFSEMVAQCEELFKGYCKRTGREFVYPGQEFNDFIEQRRKQEAQDAADAEDLKKLLK